MPHIAKQQKAKHVTRLRRIGRVAARIHGTADRPRLVVHRSLRTISAQIIDDNEKKTLVAAHSREAANDLRGTALAAAVGTLIATKAKQNGITSVVFDRRGYSYHGRVQALADAAREAGLSF